MLQRPQMILLAYSDGRFGGQSPPRSIWFCAWFGRQSRPNQAQKRNVSAPAAPAPPPGEFASSISDNGRISLVHTQRPYTPSLNEAKMKQAPRFGADGCTPPRPALKEVSDVLRRQTGPAPDRPGPQRARPGRPPSLCLQRGAAARGLSAVRSQDRRARRDDRRDALGRADAD